MDEPIIRDGSDAPAAATPTPSLADKAPAVLRAYFNSTPTFLTQHHIDTYEAAIFREIPEIILSENPIVVLKEPIKEAVGLYKYKTEIFVGGDVGSISQLNIDVGPPIITLDGGKTVRRMFANEARLRNLTYASQFRADILIRLTFTSIDESGEITTKVKELQADSFPLFRLPILLRSKLCTSYNASAELLREMGECPNDQGGYFIIDGAEKVLITRQEQALNTVFVFKRPANDLKIATHATVKCQNPKTKRTNEVSLYRMHQVGSDAKQGKNIRVEEGAIRVSIPFVKGTIPLFALFRALGVESDADIVRMIVPVPNRALEDTLIPCIHDAWPITNRMLALEFIMTLTSGFIPAHVLDIMNTHLFSHVPNRPLLKAQYLAEIVRKMMRVEMGQEPSTNRDDIRNQRLMPTGILLRDLFSNCWKLWKKAVIAAVDSQYNYNRSIYQDDNFLQLFVPANLGKSLATDELNKAIMRGFRGRWGTDSYNTKSGVLQPLARISYLDAASHTRRVVSDFDTSLKLVGPRQLHTSQVGYFCTSETPTGAHIGATKNLSIMTLVSVAAPAEPVVQWLLGRGGVIEVADAPAWIAQKATSVQVNGGTIGFTQNPGQLTNVLKMMKWTGCLAPTASVSFNTTENVVRVYLDAGRPLRPLWHLAEGGAWPAAASAAALPSWRDLVVGTLPATADHGVTATDFVDPLADVEEPAPSLAEYQSALAPHVGAVEYVDPYESNESYIDWWGAKGSLTAEHTHAEIHPSTLMGVLASMIPFANHNQSPRNQLSCSQSKQAIGYYATNYENRFDTYGSMLCYGDGAISRTIVHDAVAGGRMPYGANIIFAFNSFDGYNQDDGILFNRSSVERGLFRSIALRSYETVEEDDPLSKVVYRIGNPKYVLAWTDMKPGNDYTALDENGIIREGAVIHEKTVLVGRYMTDPETGRVVDASLLPTVFTKGRVDKVAVLHQANGLRLVKVRILEERVPELGDKFSSRHGQKGTMGMLIDAVDMPRTADGMVPDVMVNPHCIPSRMTMAQMLEQLYGKMGAIAGAKINATPFMNDAQSLEGVGAALEMLGVQRYGEEILYSGQTGHMFKSSIFMGPLNFMRLKHLTQDKLNARSAGRKEMRTHQPTGGRGNEGGMRIGEMERDVLIAHGISEFLTESMMRRSDGTEFWVCNGCGTIPIVNEAEGMFVCALCDGPLTYQGISAETIGLVLPVRKSRATFSKVSIPYAAKLLDQELTQYMNAGFRFLTQRSCRRFREPTDAVVLTKDATKTTTNPKIEEGKTVEQKLDEEEAKTTKVAAVGPVAAAGAEGAAAAAEAAAAKEAERGDVGAVEDMEDEGQPARNEGEEVVEAPPGESSIDFGAKQNKEYTTYFPSKIVLDDKEWPTVEHYYQAAKFVGNPEYAEKIRVAKTPVAAKTLGNTKDVPVRADWMKVREAVMLKANRAKFQIPALKNKLLATGTALIRNTAAQDNFWGIGRSGKGQNKLGKILMRVREELATGQAIAAAEEANSSSDSANTNPAPPKVVEAPTAPPAPAPAAPPAETVAGNEMLFVSKVGTEPVPQQQQPQQQPEGEQQGGFEIDIDTEMMGSAVEPEAPKKIISAATGEDVGSWGTEDTIKVIKF